MQKTPAQFRQLIDKYLADAATAEEKAALFNMIRQGDYVRELEQMVAIVWATSEEEQEDPALREQIFDKLKAHHRKVKRLKIWRWSAAAAVLIFLGVAGGILLRTQPLTPPSSTLTSVQPGSNKAVLVLGDQSEVPLDSIGNRVINQGGTTVSQQGGQLVYTAGSQPSGGATFNTLRTTRGGQYRLTLPDGTRLWINAASAVRYPTAFLAQERRIEVSGEVYIEVQPDQRPFLVTTPHETVEVLGTDFNINAYEDEHFTLTTLLSGKIRVLNNQQATVMLKPGEQAVVSHQTATAIPVKEVDTEQVVAWKNGYFDFENERLSAICRLLSRWYNIEFEVEATAANLQFSAVIARSSSLDQVLSALSATDVVRFSREGNTIKAHTVK